MSKVNNCFYRVFRAYEKALQSWRFRVASRKYPVISPPVQKKCSDAERNSKNRILFCCAQVCKRTKLDTNERDVNKVTLMMMTKTDGIMISKDLVFLAD